MRYDNRGIGIVEIILIIVVLMGLIIFFRESVCGLIDDIFTNFALHM